MNRAWTCSVAMAALLVIGVGAATTGPLWLIFVDDLHLEFVTTGRLRAALNTIATELIQEGDMFAVRASGPSASTVEPTTDRRRFEGVVRKVTGSGLKPADIVASSTGIHEVRYRAGVAFAAAQELIASVDDVRDRRKALIYISNGYFDAAPDSDRQPLLAHVAGLAGVTIFTIDPRLLAGSRPLPQADRAVWERYWTTTRSSLVVLAQLTGGFALEDASLAGALKRISSEMRQ